MVSLCRLPGLTCCSALNVVLPLVSHTSTWFEISWVSQKTLSRCFSDHVSYRYVFLKLFWAAILQGFAISKPAGNESEKNEVQDTAQKSYPRIPQEEGSCVGRSGTKLLPCGLSGEQPGALGLAAHIPLLTASWGLWSPSVCWPRWAMHQQPCGRDPLGSMAAGTSGVPWWMLERSHAQSLPAARAEAACWSGQRLAA